MALCVADLGPFSIGTRTVVCVGVQQLPWFVSSVHSVWVETLLVHPCYLGGGTVPFLGIRGGLFHGMDLHDVVLVDPSCSVDLLAFVRIRTPH